MGRQHKERLNDAFKERYRTKKDINGWTYRDDYDILLNGLLKTRSYDNKEQQFILLAEIETMCDRENLHFY